MEESRAGSGPSLGSSSGGAPGASQSSIESLIGALTSFMEQQRTSSSGQGATKALKGVVDKIGRFDGKNIIKFLRAYVCEMDHGSLSSTWEYYDTNLCFSCGF